MNKFEAIVLMAIMSFAACNKTYESSEAEIKCSPCLKSGKGYTFLSINFSSGAKVPQDDALICHIF